MSPDIIALTVVAAIVVVAALVMRNKANQPVKYDDGDTQPKEAEKQCRPLDEPDLPTAQPIDDRMTYMGPAGIVPDADNPCPAIQEALRRVADMPDLVVSTPPIKLTREEALRAANAQRATAAKLKAACAKADIDHHVPEAEVAKNYGYSNVKHMRAALKKHLSKAPQEVA